ncbi:MAG TPA: ATP-dependent zinc metalloprotease FtsH [Streptosporangiaceae bacterium]|nr:ATP-dependent zinc metalloprotease FtsH [Streptosporangiaceae bacterium]
MITRIRLGHTHLSRSVEPGPPKEPPKPTPPPPPTWRRWLLPIGMLILLGLLFWPSLLRSSPTTKYTFTTFQNKVTSGDVKSVSIDSNGAVTGKLSNGSEFTSQLPTALDRSQITQQLNSQHVQITATQAGGGLLETLLPSLIWLILIVGLFVWTGRAAQRQLSGIGGFGRSKAKVIEAERPTTRFTDVAGYEGVKQEISEVVDFLRDPQRYAAAGATGPRGVLMVGPPGTGKTLIARAVAGEAQVPFLSVTGSAFVELFVGVGASRVRDLFADARRRAPSIIFIDEIDAIGGRRGGAAIGGNDEREQTLNQLLSEMDGFDQTAGVVVIAATNRPESLDPALLRPGRFDRQVIVPLPNQTERAAILAVHAKGKKLAPDVDLTVTARGTPGFSGADLANLINEAAINAIRDNRTTITAADFDAARDRILLGAREATNVLLPEEKQSVAVHESGHALVAALSPNADPVAKVTILPAGMALGATHQLPEAERHLYSEAYLNDLLAVRLGGRAAELVVFGHGSTGASNDLAEATNLAIRMVREFGLSPALGPVGYSDQSGQYLGGPVQDGLRRPFSEETQRVVDQEVSRLLREAEERAVAMLNDHRDELDWLAARLVEKETVDGKVVLEVLHDKKQLVSQASGSAPGGASGPASSGASGSAPGGANGPASPG